MIAQARLRIVGTRLSGDSDLASAFGLALRRTLAVTVANVGNAPAADVTVQARVGATPQGLFREAALAPGAQRTYRVQVTVPALSVGTQRFSGVVSVPGGQQVAFSASAFRVPWAAGVVALGVVQGLALLVRNRVRRKVAGSGPPGGKAADKDRGEESPSAQANPAPMSPAATTGDGAVPGRRPKRWHAAPHVGRQRVST